MGKNLECNLPIEGVKLDIAVENNPSIMGSKHLKDVTMFCVGALRAILSLPFRMGSVTFRAR